jgi:autotransporter family porin
MIFKVPPWVVDPFRGGSPRYGVAIHRRAVPTLPSLPTPTPARPTAAATKATAVRTAAAETAATVWLSTLAPPVASFSIVPEVALAAVVPEVARNAVRTTLGTFQDREGEQAFASGDGGFKAGWARVFGRSYQQTWSGDVNPSFNGSIWGIQAGFPVLGLEHSSGEKDRAGLFFAYTNANGSVTGFALGQQGAPVGSLGVNIYSVGAYWTHFWPAGGYLDAVLMESFMTASTQSVSNVSSTDNGRMFTASLELGYPIPVFSNWAIEPQAQFIYQRFGNDLYTDPFAQISSTENNFFTGRFGARVVANFVTEKMTIKPFVLA